MRVLVRLLQIVLPLAVLAVAGLAALIMIRSRPEVETQPMRIEPPGVRVQAVVLDDVRLSVMSEGTVRPRTESQLVPEISGRVMSIAPSFAEGGFFEAGDVLVTIDPFDYQQAVISARSQLAQARLRLAEEEAEAEVAQREWAELGQGSPRELTLRKPQLENAHAAVAAAEANVERAKRDLERAEITAPYAGRVRRKNVDVGQFVTIGNVVATIYAVDVAEIRLPLPDEQLAYLNLPLAYRGTQNRPGPRVTFRTTFAGKTYAWRGRIVRTESEIDPISRMVHAVAEVQDPYAAGPDPDRPPLAVGMYVQAEIEGREFDQIAVMPRVALRGRNQVMVIADDNRVRFRDVEILRSTTESVYIEGGLAEGELVAVSTIDSPTDGMFVQVTNATDQLVGNSIDPAPAASAQALEVAATPEQREAAAAQPAWLQELLGEGGGDSPTASAARPRAPRVSPTRPPVEPVADAAREATSTPTETVAVPTTRPETTPSSPRANPVAVLPFTDFGQQTDVAIGTAVSREVSERLTNIDTVTLVGSADNARWVVGGGVQWLGEAVRITARLIDAEQGHVVRAVKVDGDAADLLRLRDEVAAAVSRGIREVLGIASDTPPPVDMPVMAVAVRLFSNLSQETDDAALALTTSQAVATHLVGTGVLTVVSSETDARWAVAGGVQRVGGMIRITARLVDLRGGVVLQAVKVDGPVSELSRHQEEVGAAMSDSVREALTSATADAQ